MSDPSKQQLASELKINLKRFTGDLERYRHSLFPKLIYTPGVKYLAETAGAYWLIDLIASHLISPEFQRAARQDSRILDLHFWNLSVSKDNSAVATARVDHDEAPFVEQKIPYTDFPLETIDLWLGFDGRFFTLYLPSEH